MTNIDNNSEANGEARIIIFQTPVFRSWLRKRDKRTRARIDDRLKRFASGHAGDVKPLGDGLLELRLHFGPGYRIYHVWQGAMLILLLIGGDKSTQSRDIAKARALAKEAEDGIESGSV